MGWSRAAGGLGLAPNGRMNRRGFTMIEIVIVLAIVGIVAAIAVASFEATRRNTSLDAIAQEIGAQAQGLRSRALGEQVDHILLLVSPPGNDVSNCGIVAVGDCVRAFVLRAPQPGWNVAAFDPDNPGLLADFVDSTSLPRGIALDLAAAGTAAPAPFDAVTSYAPDVRALCAGGRTCVAMRFGANGEVRPEYWAAPGLTRAGVAIGLATDQRGLNAAAQRRALLVSFPAGIVRVFSY